MFKEKICNNCGKSFIPNYRTQLYCGSKIKKIGCSYSMTVTEYKEQARLDRIKNPQRLKEYLRVKEYLRLYRIKNKERISGYNKTRKIPMYTTKQRFLKMIYDAKSRNLPVMLTIEEYENLIKLPCYLCGELVVSEHGGHGIDRIDNSMGYTMDNCRSCCGICNRMKRHFSIDDFIIKIKKILQNYNKTEGK